MRCIATILPILVLLLGCESGSNGSDSGIQDANLVDSDLAKSKDSQNDTDLGVDQDADLGDAEQDADLDANQGNGELDAYLIDGEYPDIISDLEDCTEHPAFEQFCPWDICIAPDWDPSTWGDCSEENRASRYECSISTGTNLYCICRCDE